jgi:hypothetical protein
MTQVLWAWRIEALEQGPHHSILPLSNLNDRSRGPRAGFGEVCIWPANPSSTCGGVESFLDSDGDGIGDFRGLTERIDYLAGLGVTCLWLMPFFPSPQQDDGYDIADYFSVDPRLGDLGSFTELMQTAEANGIKVIADSW